MGELKIILASASPRRRELLEQIGLTFEIMVSNVEEKVEAVEPGEVVEELSRQKAEAVAASLTGCEERVLVIGADTVVALGTQILGKPSDAEEAVKMLTSMAGKGAAVYKRGTLLYPGGAHTQRKSFY